VFFDNSAAVRVASQQRGGVVGLRPGGVFLGVDVYLCMSLREKRIVTLDPGL
jgi:hypothetical protein